MNASARTRKVYAAEDALIAHLRERRKWCVENVSIYALRVAAHRVWSAQGYRIPLPQIIAGDGMRNRKGGRLHSFCEERYGHPPRIVLARDQRNLVVLLHELVHASGIMNHGIEFVSRYKWLLRSHAHVDPDVLDEFFAGL